MPRDLAAGRGTQRDVTENISRDGMLLRWEDSSGRLPSVGEMLIVEVELPEQEGFERRCIRCQSTVARVNAEPDAAVSWVGLRIHAMEFRVAQGAPVHREPVSQKGYGQPDVLEPTNAQH
jgi:c-di-GMP-binding flagellar brake protein YcgR